MAKLIFFCGKMAAGKSTLAKELAARERAVVLNQDELLDRLFPSEVIDVPSYIKCSSRLNSAVGPIVRSLLALGTSVVLDFPGNTRSQRAWFRELFEQAGAEHELHFIDAPDALCRRQLKERSKHLPPGTPWTSEAEFDLITGHFMAPSDDEQFNVVRHHRDAWCRRLGLGLITVGPRAPLVVVQVDPHPYRPRQLKGKKVRLFGEFVRRVGDPNVGGATRLGLVTASRQEAMRCASFLLEHGATKAAVVANASGVAHARRIMADNHYGWFQRVGTGFYDVTPEYNLRLDD